MKRVLKLIGIALLSIGMLMGLLVGIVGTVLILIEGGRYVLGFLGGIVIIACAVDVLLNIASKHLA